ncbi:MAG: hypothetical protein IKQ10_05460 [Oscillospiraceae bacterium]|nr:hypothetical protein [Oscillospiraceae bacterium]
MRPIQNAGGHVGLTARNYPIAASAAISAGQVVKLSAGKVISAVAAETGAVLGIAAENHPGAADVLNPRANGTEILVYDNPELIFECPVPVIEAAAANSSATAVAAKSGEVAATTADDAFNGGVLVLKSKASGSTNTDPVGKRMDITDYAKTNLVFTKASGGVANAGDRYEVYPPVGFTAGALDSSGFARLLVSATGATSVKVVGHDYDRHMIRCKAAKHALASST